MSYKAAKLDIAIIGIAGRFPMARNTEEFWENLKSGKDCITEVPKERWDIERFYSPNPEDKNKTYSRWGGFIEDAFEFDPAFFNISPTEAALMDPQQRKALEVAYEAMENAGYGEHLMDNTDTGVFLGVMGRGFYERLLAENAELKGHLLISSLIGFTANRLSFHFNLKGPSVTVDTLCSSSLVAVHQACKSIMAGECTAALAGGVYVNFSPEHYIMLSRMKVLSGDGHCKTFDEAADGIASGEGVGILMLKELGQALRDGDRIHAVIKGLSVNNDGRSARFTTTNPEAQEAMITRALEVGGINPETVTYIETHGTGTALGDPVELMALKRTFEKFTGRKSFCALGAVKANIGHLEPAAGIAGLIKTVLAIKNRQLPPMRHLKRLNHYIDVADSPFLINDKLTDWNPECGILRAGISSFGMGGTNAHILLEEPPATQIKNDTARMPSYIFTISAKRENALSRIALDMYSFLSRKPAPELHNLCYTANRSRGDFAYRAAIFCEDLAGLRRKLEELAKEGLPGKSGRGVYYGRCNPGKGTIVLVFNGRITPGSGLELLKYNAAFKEALRQCGEIVKPYLKRKALSGLLKKYPTGDQRLDLLAAVCVEYACARAILSLGVKPRLYAYRGAGQYAAAAAAGVIGPEEGIKRLLEGKPVPASLGNIGEVVRLHDLSVGQYEKKKTDAVIDFGLRMDGKDFEQFMDYLARLYITGVSMDWERLYGGYACEKLSLPTYPFEKRTYAPAKASPKEEFAPSGAGAAKGELHPLVDALAWSSLNQHIYSTLIDDRREAELSDHRVTGRAVLPGVAYLELARAAGSHCAGKPLNVIRELLLLSPLPVKSGVCIHTRIEKGKEGLGFSIAAGSSGNPGEAGWTEHAAGKLSYEDEEPENSRCIDQLKRECAGKLDLKEFYDYFEYTGIDYGPRFKRLGNVLLGEDCAFASIKAAEERAADCLSEKREGYAMHPSLMDGALQAVIALLFGKVNNKKSPYLPYYFKKVTFYRPVCSDCCCYVKLQEGIRLDSPTVKANVLIMDMAGGLLVKMSGVAFKRLGAAEAEDGEKAARELNSGLFYHPEWVEKPLEVLRLPVSSGTRLVFSDSAPAARLLSEEAGGRETNVIRVARGESFERKSEAYYQINPGAGEDYFRLVQSVLGEGGELKSIVNLWPLEGSGGDTEGTTLENKLEAGVYCVFFLLQALARAGVDKPLDLLLATGNAQAVVADEARLVPEDAAVWGLARTVPLEFPNIRCCCLDLEEKGAEDAVQELLEELETKLSDAFVAYRKGRRYVWTLSRYEIGASPIPSLSFRENGVYIITGGLGDIGLELAKHICLKYGSRLALISRSEPEQKPEHIRQAVEALKRSGARVICITADVGDETQVLKAIRQVKAKWGGIDGVFHTAGVLRDGLIKSKPPESFREVLWPKVNGTLALFRALQNEKLDFMILFSSISSVAGNTGQGDYAAANAFMDCFAAYARQKGIPCTSINWSFWEIGMGKAFQCSAKNKGYMPLKVEDALNALCHAAGLGLHQVAVADRMEDKLPGETANRGVFQQTGHEAGLRKWIENRLTGEIAALLEYPAEDIDLESSFTQLGMDSILAGRLAGVLSEIIGADVDATLVFDYPNVSSMAAYFEAEFRPQLQKLMSGDGYAQAAPEEAGGPVAAEETVKSLERRLLEILARVLEYSPGLLDNESSFMSFGLDSILAARFAEEVGRELKINLDATLVFDYPNISSLADCLAEEYGNQPASVPADREKARENAGADREIEGLRETFAMPPGSGIPADASLPWAKEPHDRFRNMGQAGGPPGCADGIAVIGMAGRFAGARDTQEYWKNIAGGVCGVTGFPEDRATGLALYDDPEYLKRRGKLFGSFLERIDEFDPLFFEISPREAELMDPQQRVLLEAVWHAVEDAGYTRKRLADSKTGVFIGACITEYAKYINEFDSMAGTGNELSILSNRISYLFNLKGPSMTIDTACSSSLVAIDAACQNIAAGRCDMAIAGGVNLILTPWFSIVFEKAGMLSGDGLCKTFDQSADGYVRGEGVGVLLLKPLSKAVHDRDNILAVIRGSGVNQDGRTNGLTAPNALAQEEVILEAWKSSGIDPRTISLVEAHGTGTSLGDPIEIKGLTRAFRNFTSDRGFCAIGSVKSNIGHLEPAAGVSGIIKLIQALVNKKLPPTLHFNSKNKLISFEDSPFYVNDRMRDWEPEQFPRRAAVSSFGFGGTNAHVVLEEAPACGVSEKKPYYGFHVAVLSARSRGALADKARELYAFLGGKEVPEFENTTYTLSAKREHFASRLAFVTDSSGGLRLMLKAYLESGASGSKPAGVFQGETNAKNGCGLALTFSGRWSRYKSSGYKLYRLYRVFREAADACGAVLEEKTGISLRDIWDITQVEGQARRDFDLSPIAAFILGYSLAELLSAWGLRPEAVTGAGAGLYAAACFAGMLKLEEAVLLAFSIGKTEADHSEFERTLKSVKLRTGRLPLLDPVTGRLFPEGGHAAELIEHGLQRTRTQRPCPESLRGLGVRLLLETGEAEEALGSPGLPEKEGEFEYVPSLTPSCDEHYSLLSALARLYVRGVSVNWDGVYQDFQLDQVRLPAYPYQRKKYWAGGKDERRAQFSFSQKEWYLKPLEITQGLNGGRVWVLLADGLGLADRLRPMLEDRGQKVATVVRGTHYHCIDASRFAIDCHNQEDYVTLLKTLEKEYGGVDGIVHMWTLDRREDIAEDWRNADQRLAEGVYSLFYLSKALAGLGRSQNTRLVTITANARPVKEGTLLSPENALVPAFIKIVPYEIQGIAAGNIDFSIEKLDGDYAAGKIAEELSRIPGADDIAYTEEGRWVSRIRTVHMDPLPEITVPGPGETVMITGGATGVGFRVARHLAKTRNVKLALVGRSTIPPEDQWESFLAKAYDPEAAIRVTNLKELIDLGCQVKYIAADVSDMDGMRKAASEARDHLGNLRCIIHCAGIIDSRFISINSKTCDSFRNTLVPKIHGTLVLKRIMEEEEVPLMVLFSSVACLEGFTGAGFSDYAVANAFLDALARAVSQKIPGRCISINWPVWAGVGMSNRGLTTRADYSLKPEEALKAFDMILKNPVVSNVIVTGGDGPPAGELPHPKQVAYGSPKVQAEAEAAAMPAAGTGRADESGESVEEAACMLKSLLMKLLRLSPEDMDMELNFSEYGLDSLTLADLMGGIEAYYGIHLEPSVILTYPTIASLAGYLTASFGARSEKVPVQPGAKRGIAENITPPEPETSRGEKASEGALPAGDNGIAYAEGPNAQKIAVIGAACEFPGADNMELFWENLKNGVDSISEIPGDRWPMEEFFHPDPTAENRSYAKWGGFISGIGKIDADFFNMTEEDVVTLEPQHMLALETAWKAFEHAGYGSSKGRPGEVGVFWGARGAHRTIGEMNGCGKESASPSNRNFILGRAQNMIAARISDFLDLKGPAVVLDTACSSSLAGIHMACQSIRCGECEMALAGGVDLLVSPEAYIGLSKARAISPDGKCFTFDKRANGYVPGEGAGAVVLKSFEKARRDGDRIYAVILGSAVNNDGHTMGITTPDLEGQKAVINKALKYAGIQPSTISYVEAHGTGTTIGDPIEIKALTQCYSNASDRKGFCAVGSVKTNIGHLHSASGIAGFIKVVLALHNRRIPPTLHCREPNPRFDFSRSPFYIADRLTDWAPLEEKRRAAVSSFGFGGTNCHMILEEGPKSTASMKNNRGDCSLFTLSARTEEDLKQMAENYLAFFASRPEEDLSKACHTANTGRERFKYRLAFTAGDAGELKSKLAEAVSRPLKPGGGVYAGCKSRDHSGRVVLMFTGQGSLYTGVAQELYRSGGVFRRILEDCSDILRQYIKKPVEEYLFSRELGERIQETAITQPVTFALDYALACMWMSWGVRPSVVLGHSLGEYVAACVAGVFGLEDALKLVALRGRLMQDLPGNGAMAALAAGFDEVSELLKGLSEKEREIPVAASDNGPASVVVSGERRALDEFLSIAAEKGIKSTKLRVSHAFHSPLMEPMLPGFESALEGIRFSRPKIRLLSNVTGRFADNELMDRRYWLEHIRKPVLFRKGIETLVSDGYRILLEAGPGNTLCGMAKQSVPPESGVILSSTLIRGRRDWGQILEASAQLFAGGAELDLASMDEGLGLEKTALPHYPFNRRDFLGRGRPAAPSGSKEAVNNSTDSGRAGKGGTVFYRVLNTREDIVLRDHQILGKQVLPGVCHWEIAVKAASDKLQRPGGALTEITHKAPVDVGDEKVKTLRLTLGEGKETFFKIEAYDESLAQWAVKTEGKITSLPEKTPADIDIEDLKKRTSTSVLNAEALYSLFKGKGMDYGPFFRSVAEVRSGESEALADISIPSEFLDTADRFTYHPALLDGALQAISGILNLRSNCETYMPFHIERADFYGSLPARCYSCVKLTRVSPGNEIVRADVKITDRSGRVLVMISGFSLKKAASEGPAGGAERQAGFDIERWFYKLSWTSAPLRSSNSELPRACRVVLADRENPVHSRVIRRLRLEGQQVLPAYSGNTFVAHGSGEYTIHPGSKEHFDLLLEDILSSGRKIDGFIHLWTCGPGEDRLSDEQKLMDSQQAGSYSLLYLVQSIYSQRLSGTIPLMVVTSNSQPVYSADSVLAPENATMLGIVKTLAVESGAIEAKYMDMDIRSDSYDRLEEHLINEIKEGKSDSVVGYRGGGRFVQRMEGMDRREKGPLGSLELRDNGVYIITGGLGGIGLEIAGYLSGKIRARLALIGRSPFPEEGCWDEILARPDEDENSCLKDRIRKLRNIRSAGAEISLHTADVTSYGQMEKCVEEIKSRFGSINGVFHSAGELSDSLTVNMTIDSFRRVLFPKMLGAWILHKVTENEGTDFMVLFSGLVSFVGIVGQSNHTAANCFEDSFAYYRNFVAKRRTQVINWGIWGGTGVVAKPFYTEGLKNLGFIPMDTADALNAFEKALNAGEVQIGIGNITPLKEKELGVERPWQPPEQKAEDLFIRVVEKLEELKPMLFETRTAERDISFGNDLEGLCAAYAFDFFAGHGVFAAGDKKYALEEIRSLCGVREKYGGLLESMLEMCRKKGFVHAENGFYSAAAGKEYSPPDSVADRLLSEYADRDTAVFIRLLKHCMKHYPEVLEGRLNAMQVLFPGGSPAMLEELYNQPSPYNVMAGRAVAEYLRGLRPGRRVRILEIGGGTGGTTAKILPEITGHDVEYRFTDISPVLLKQARERFKSYPFIKYEILDIEKSPEEQGFEGRAFDIVVAANVLHATKALRATFSKVRELMAYPSLLVLLETTKVTGFADLVFGLTDGWWLFEDKELRRRSALLTPEAWEKTLGILGFERVKALPQEQAQTVTQPYSLIVAQPVAPVAAQSSENTVEQTNLTPRTGEKSARPPQSREPAEAENPAAGDEKFTEKILTDRIAALLNCPPDTIDREAGFLETGLDSLSLVSLAGALEKEAGVKLYPTLFFEYQTIAELAGYLAQKYPREFTALYKTTQNNGTEKGAEENSAAGSAEAAGNPEEPERRPQNTKDGGGDIAIIGMAGIFPQADDIQEFWENLRNGMDCVKELDESRWDSLTCYDEKPGGPGKTYCKWGGLVDRMDEFDAAFFNISPKEAKRMDPQQRLFLETALSAAENAGYGGSRLYGSKTGVFAGVSNHNYHSLAFDPGDTFCVLGTSNAMVANRFSYFMNLNGPSLVIDTQCSSSLVALNYACKSILSGECEMAIAGGSNFIIPDKYYILLSQVKALSPDGRCKTFDSSADGFVSGEGACALLLKRLDAAIEDGDNIHAVIKSSSVNHDGRSNNVAAPNSNAQFAVITDAIERAGVNPETITYVEAHGTGTSLGDPVELSALTRSFARYTDRKSFCAIGSVKTNIGHLEAGAGIAGVIKVAMAMKHKQLPKSLHFKRPNPYLDFNGSPFYVNDALRRWVSDGPRRAGVSSFGMGGANAHVVMEEAPARKEKRADGPARPFTIAVLSAKSKSALLKATQNLEAHLEKNREQKLADICYTLAAGRGHYSYRRAVIASEAAELRAKLRELCLCTEKQWGPGDGIYQGGDGASVKKAGGGLLLIFTDRGLHPGTIRELLSEKTFSEAFDAAGDGLELDPGQSLRAFIDPSGRGQAASAFKDDACRKAARFVGQFALAELLLRWGLTPCAVFGHGTGKYTAAAVAGQLSWEEAIRQIAATAGLDLKRGWSADVPDRSLTLPVWTPARGEIIENRPFNTAPDGYESGEYDFIKPLYEKIREKSVHTAMEISDDDYITVKARSFMEDNNEKNPHFTSVGVPGATAWRSVLGTVAGNYADGADIDWKAFFGGEAAKIIELPAYPFEGKKYWTDTGRAKPERVRTSSGYRVKGFMIKNRMVKAAIDTGAGTAGGMITESYLDYYRNWAQGQIGLNIAGNVMVCAKGCESGREIVISRENPQPESLSALVRTARAGGSVFIVQLNHAGGKAAGGTEGAEALGPSELQAEGKNIKAASEEQLRELIRQFAEAAGIIRRAGADGIELHAAHEFLIAQFLSPKTNLRKDAWGGTAEKRRRFLLEIVRAVRKETGDSCLILVKLDAPDEAKNGITLKDAVDVAVALQEAGADMLELSAGIPSGRDILNTENKNHFIKRVSQIKAHIKIPVIATGGMRELETMEEILQKGEADFIGLGRPLICEPHWVKGLLKGEKASSSCSSCSLCIMALSAGAAVCLGRKAEKAGISPSSHVFHNVWEERELAASGQLRRPGRWIVLDPYNKFGQKLADSLKKSGRSVVLAESGEHFFRVDQDYYKIDFTRQEDYERLLAAAARGGPAGVVHLGGLGGERDCAREHGALDRALEKGLFSLLLLAKSAASAGGSDLTRLVTLTRNAQPYGNGSKLRAENSTVTGLTRVIPYEVKQLSAKTIDLDMEPADYSRAEELIENELDSFDAGMEEISYRNNKRYVKVIRPLEARQQEERTPGGRIRGDGVYLVTGGLSGLGLILAGFIARKRPLGLVLTGRKRLPEKHEWAALLERSDGEDAISEAVKALRELQSTGVRVEYRCADVSDREAMGGIVAEIKQSMGKLRGVIHCAGMIDHVSRTLRTKTVDSFKRILLPKVQGTLVLDAVTSNEELDFMLFCSSIAALKGKLGAALSDYAVANAFMDHYALGLAAERDYQTVSVNWSIWDGIGHGARKAQGDMTFPLAVEAGLKAFEYILLHGIKGNISVMNVNASNFSLENLNRDETKTGENTKKADRGKEAQQAGRGMPAEGRDRVEEFIAGLLVRFLQLDRNEINKRRDFAEYGIDSVIVTDIVGAIEERYKIFTHPSVVLEHPNVKALARYLTETCAAAEKEAVMQDAREAPVTGEDEVLQEAAAGSADAPAGPEKETAEADKSGGNGEPDLMELLKGLSTDRLTVEQAIERYGGLL